MLACFSTATFAQATAQQALDNNFGKLPPNQISTWGLSGVRTEIALQYLIDPSLVKDKLPQGFSPFTANDVAQHDSDTAKWLETHPLYRGYLFGTLIFTSLDSLVIDDSKVNRHGPANYASWWVFGKATSPLDKAALGEVGVQLAAWYPDTGVDRRKLVSDPTIEFAKVEVANTRPGEWLVHLKIKGGEITGDCREEGERTEMKYPVPAYSTIFEGAPDPSRYTIYTYYGHYERHMHADWQFTGNHLLARSLSAMKIIYPFHTTMEDSWRARAGLYKVAK
jgi:hypothetical protein